MSYVNDLFLAGGGSGRLNTSTDAISWTLRTIGTNSSGNQYFYGDGKYFSGTANELRSSTNAIQWSSFYNAPNTQYAYVYNNGILGVGNNGLMTASELAVSSAAGNGGNATRGGGGGGGGYTSVTNSFGIGGNGGDGYVRITWW